MNIFWYNFSNNNAIMNIMGLYISFESKLKSSTDYFLSIQ